MDNKNIDKKRRVLKTETGSACKVIVIDEPGAGNASRQYLMTGGYGYLGPVVLQNGPVKENGVNGCTQEDLLAIVIDRLQGFQAGDYACEENARALRKAEEALGWLRYRTADREARGVKGTGKI